MYLLRALVEPPQSAYLSRYFSPYRHADFCSGRRLWGKPRETDAGARALQLVGTTRRKGTSWTALSAPARWATTCPVELKMGRGGNLATPKRSSTLRRSVSASSTCKAT